MIQLLNIQTKFIRLIIRSYLHSKLNYFYLRIIFLSRIFESEIYI